MTYPLNSGNELLSLNPLAKVPALETEDGSLFDSPILCEYIDSLAVEPPLIPADFRQRIHTMRLQSLADGVMDAAVASVLELQRTDASPSAFWLNRREVAIRRAVRAFTESRLPNEIQLDGIAVACALAYLDFRMPDFSWREEHAALSSWFSAYSDRQSFADTAPPTTR
ncbi:glutathione S-transferase N-terminal domain-containing protein [Paraburkholderia pallida]|uniref:glutathione S-transferase N-terminal domain-containing protein n=1 Tax=Paraburkholderia pallida TaxID=2547399 RepID=UPI00143037CE|nr:glutathione S-transferase N-terminal domain-containing protein [Paraburkholderia pallida]